MVLILQHVVLFAFQRILWVSFSAVKSRHLFFKTIFLPKHNSVSILGIVVHCFLRLAVVNLDDYCSVHVLLQFLLLFLLLLLVLGIQMGVFSISVSIVIYWFFYYLHHYLLWERSWTISHLGPGAGKRSNTAKIAKARKPRVTWPWPSPASRTISCFFAVTLHCIIMLWSSFMFCGKGYFLNFPNSPNKIKTTMNNNDLALFTHQGQSLRYDTECVWFFADYLQVSSRDMSKAKVFQNRGMLILQ